jgi:hypothetical protein
MANKLPSARAFAPSVSHCCELLLLLLLGRLPSACGAPLYWRTRLWKLDLYSSILSISSPAVCVYVCV